MVATKEYSKQYYLLHKDKMKEQLKKRLTTKIFCHECNTDITKANFHQHNKTQKHLRNKENFKAGEGKPIRNESDLLNLFSQIKNALDTLEKNESKAK